MSRACSHEHITYPPYPSRFAIVDRLDDCLNQPPASCLGAIAWVPDWHRDNGSHSAHDNTGRDSDSDSNDSGWFSSDESGDSDDEVFTLRLLAPPPPENTAVLVNRRGAAYGASSASQDAGRSSSARQNANRPSSACHDEADDDDTDSPDGHPFDNGGWFDRDGCIVTFLEGTPGIGFIVAIVHLIRDDKDRALRATAECAYSSIVLSGAVAGEFFGGPLGAGLGGMAATPLAMLVKNWISQDIGDPEMRAKTAVELSIKAVLKEMVINGGVSVLSTFLGRWFGNWLFGKWGLEGLVLKLCRSLISMLTKPVIRRILKMLGLHC